MSRTGLALLLLICYGCSSPQYLSKPEEFKDHVKGLTMKCNLKGRPDILGEIIEVNDQEIILLSLKSDRKIYTISKSKLHRSEILVAGTSNNPKGISLWAGLINLLSISHGVLAMVSLPVNLIVTISVGSDAAYSTYSIYYPHHIGWDDMRKFARFPQGLPDHIPKEQIR